MKKLKLDLLEVEALSTQQMINKKGGEPFSIALGTFMLGLAMTSLITGVIGSVRYAMDKP